MTFFVLKPKENSMIKFIYLLPFLLFSFALDAQENINLNTEKTMTIEIWSDVVCPFCYIGKRKLETALNQFEHKDKVKIVWKSYLLDPDTEENINKDAYTYLAERKGQTREWSVQAHQYVTQMAKEVGLNYDFDKVKMTSSKKAHRLIQLAKKYDKGNAIEEALFNAYFIEGKLISDIPTLIALGEGVGLDKKIIEQTLNSEDFTTEMNNDIKAAETIGVSGVPFFVFDRKYAISGAQDTKLFWETLQKTFSEK